MASQQDLLTVFAEILIEMGQVDGADAIRPESPLAELGLDSLSTLEFLMLVDERTGVEVAVEELAPETTLAELSEIVSRKSA